MLVALGALVVLAIIVGSSADDAADIAPAAAQAPEPDESPGIDVADSAPKSTNAAETLPIGDDTATDLGPSTEPRTSTPTSMMLSSSQAEPSGSDAPVPSTSTPHAVSDESTTAGADDPLVPEPERMTVREGPFVAIEVGEFLICGLRNDGHVECWDAGSANNVESPDSKYTSIETGGATGCGLRVDGGVECWGFGLQEPFGYAGEDPFTTGEGPFTSFAVSWGTVCAVRFDGVVICAGNEIEPHPHKPLAVDVISVAARELVFCAITIDREAVCWDYWSRADDEASPPRAAQPPDGPYERLFVGDEGEVACALRQDQSAACWGSIAASVRPGGPVEHFSKLAVGRFRSCGLRPSGAIVCWDHDPDGGQDSLPGNEPAGEFVDISVDRAPMNDVAYSCTVRMSGELLCWRADVEGHLPVPRGQFTAIDTKAEVSCGLRRDGAAVCWRQPF